MNTKIETMKTLMEEYKVKCLPLVNEIKEKIAYPLGKTEDVVMSSYTYEMCAGVLVRLGVKVDPDIRYNTDGYDDLITEKTVEEILDEFNLALSDMILLVENFDRSNMISPKDQELNAKINELKSLIYQFCDIYSSKKHVSNGRHNIVEMAIGILDGLGIPLELPKDCELKSNKSAFDKGLSSMTPPLEMVTKFIELIKIPIAYFKTS